MIGPIKVTQDQYKELRMRRRDTQVDRIEYIYYVMSEFGLSFLLAQKVVEEEMVSMDFDEYFPQIAGKYEAIPAYESDTREVVYLDKSDYVFLQTKILSCMERCEVTSYHDLTLEQKGDFFTNLMKDFDPDKRDLLYTAHRQNFKGVRPLNSEVPTQIPEVKDMLESYIGDLYDDLTLDYLSQQVKGLKQADRVTEVSYLVAVADLLFARAEGLMAQEKGDADAS